MRDGGMKGRREGWRDKGTERGMEEWRNEGMEGWREGGRDGGREDGMDGGMEGRRDGEMEGGMPIGSANSHIQKTSIQAKFSVWKNNFVYNNLRKMLIAFYFSFGIEGLT